MIYFIDSKDRDETLRHIDLMKKKEPGFHYEKIEEETTETLIELAGRTSLFGEIFMYSVSMGDALGGSFDFFVQNKEILEKSQHILLIDGYAKPLQGKKFSDNFDNYIKVSQGGDFKKPSAEGFLLAEYIFKRDKKNAWVLYQKLKQKDISSRELLPQVWWQLKTCLQVLNGITKDVKPYSVSKTKSLLGASSHEEAKSLIRSFMDNFSAEPSDKDLERKFEAWILSL